MSDTTTMKRASGSLAVAYSDHVASLSVAKQLPYPFMVGLPRDEIAHIFDTQTVQIILGDLDTFIGFASFIDAKEEAIRRHELLAYAGEQDLLTEYYSNFDKKSNRHFVGTPSYQGVLIPEGKWLKFVQGLAALFSRRETAHA